MDYFKNCPKVEPFLLEYAPTWLYSMSFFQVGNCIQFYSFEILKKSLFLSIVCVYVCTFSAVFVRFKY